MTISEAKHYVIQLEHAIDIVNKRNIQVRQILKLCRKQDSKRCFVKQGSKYIIRYIVEMQTRFMERVESQIEMVEMKNTKSNR